MKGCKKNTFVHITKKIPIILLFGNKIKSERYLMGQYPKCYKCYFILIN